MVEEVRTPCVTWLIHGVSGLVVDRKPVTRTLNPEPNASVQMLHLYKQEARQPKTLIPKLASLIKDKQPHETLTIRLKPS